MKTTDFEKELGNEEEFIEHYWRNIIGYIRRDLANMWGDEVKISLDKLKEEAQKLAFIFKKLNENYKKDRKYYTTEISDIRRLLYHLNRIEAKKKWVSLIHNDLKEIVNDIEIERRKLDSVYSNTNFQYGRLLASRDGNEIMNSNRRMTELLLNGSYRMVIDIEKGSTIRSGMKRFIHEEKDLNKYLEGVFCKSIGWGAEGTVYQVRYPAKTIILKIFCVNPNHLEERGINLFIKLLNLPKNTKYRFPKPYFANNVLCAIEDFSGYPDYFAFVKKYPNEKIKLDWYIKSLLKKDPVKVDHGAIFDPKHQIREEKSSIFIMNYNPEAEKNEKRFEIGAVDFI